MKTMLQYHAPESLDEALKILGRGGVDLIAGGTDHYPARPQGGTGRSLLDVSRIEALRGIGRSEDGWRIGAAATWSDVLRADLPAAFDGLKAAAREVGARQIQNAGTVAGNICNASPAADGVPPLLTLDAEVEVVSTQGTRRVPLSKVITGVRRVDLHPGEIVMAVHVPPLPEGAQGHFSKLGSREYLVISIAMVAMVLRQDDQGRINHARVAVGACSPVARRLPGLEAEMIGQRPEDMRITPAHLAGLSPIDDVRASAAYRLEAVQEILARMLKGVAR